MGRASQRASARTRRPRAVPDGLPSAATDESSGTTETLDAIFAALPEAPPASTGIPEIIRRNRRERARRRLRDALVARGPYPLRPKLREELRTLAERWAQRGFEDAFPEADEFEIRCVDERAVLDAAARGDEEERFAAAERAYLREVERKHGRIEIRGLQLSARVHQDLEISYVPLHIEEPFEADPPRGPKKATARKKPGAAAAKPDDEVMAAMVRALDRARVPATQALAKHPRLLLIGEPGSGKSTLVAYLATRAARGELGADAGWAENPVPFLVPVRSLQATPESLEELAHVAGAEPWFLGSALQRGRALLLVDGLDEARPEVADEILARLTTMLDVHPGTRALVTTRPSGAPGEETPVPKGFTRCRLVPMTREEVGRFIDQWCLAAELSLAKTRGQAEADARAAADDLKDRVQASRAIERLAQTPLLCSVICVVHRFLGQRIPERRVALYEAITNVLLYEWDRSKFPEGAATGKLDAHSKRALLARLARTMHDAGVAELPADDVVSKLAAHLPDLGQPAEDAAAIVAEIRDRNGVLVERAPGSFAFSHLTFQEYFAALDLVIKRDYDALLRSYKDRWWHEVIVLAAGFPGADAAKIVRELLRRDGEKARHGTMLATQCAETAIELPASLRSELEQRVATLITPNGIKDSRTFLRLGIVAGPVLLRALDRATDRGKKSILLFLGKVAYEPATSALIRFISGSTTTQRSSHSPVSAENVNTNLVMSATVAMMLMVIHSDAAFSNFLAAIPSAHTSAIRIIKSTLRQETGFPDYVTSKLEALIERYEAAHREPAFASAPAPRRAARSG